MIVMIACILALLVLSGSATIVWGGRRFRLSAGTLALAFAITAASWMAFLIATISMTVQMFAGLST